MIFRETMRTLGEWTMRRPGPILTGTLILALAAGWAASKLGVDNDITNLLPGDNPVARSYTEISDAFSGTSTLAVVVEGADRKTLTAAAEAFAAGLAADPRTAGLVRSVQLKVDKEFASRWGLLLQDTEELAETDRILASSRLMPLIRATNDLMEEKLADGDDEEVEGAEGEDDAFALMSRFGRFASELRTAVEDEAAYSPEGLSDTWLFGEEYMLDPEGKTLLLLVRPSFDLGERKNLAVLCEVAKTLAGETGARFPGVGFRFTGDVANEADEDQAIRSDIFYPSILAVLLILGLFLLSFRRKRAILFALAALALGVLVDMGFAAITVRKLNIITSSFGALLVGLGIDFGIHIVSRFDAYMETEGNPASAMGRVFASVGAPVLVGGLTTALAFYSLALSSTLAFRQFGLIAGTGILTTLAAAFLVLPALIAAFPARASSSRRLPMVSFPLIPRITAAAGRRRLPFLAAGAAVTLLALANLPNNKFEYDMRRIGPQGTEAQEAERIVADRFGVSTWRHMAGTPGLEEARALGERFRDAPLVRRVESAADFIPSPGEQRERLAAMAPIAAREGRTDGPGWDAKTVDALLYEIQRLEWNVIELGDLAAVTLGEESLPVRKRDAMIREILGAETGAPGQEVFGRLRAAVEALPRGEAASILSRIDDGFSASLDRKIRRMASPGRTIALPDLPEDVRSDYVSPEGSKYLVIIQGAPDLVDSSAILRFTDGLRAVDPTATGSLALGTELSREVVQEARSASILVALIVFAIVWIGFRSLVLSALTETAFVAAFVWMFGVQPFLRDFNIVNALSLPLILGVGVDYCVHIVSALREPGDRDHAIAQSCRSVTLSMLTTLIGFGSLALIGSYAGIASLGETLGVGIFVCYIAAIALAPALVPAARRSSLRARRIEAAALSAGAGRRPEPAGARAESAETTSERSVP